MEVVGSHFALLHPRGFVFFQKQIDNAGDAKTILSAHTTDESTQANVARNVRNFGIVKCFLSFQLGNLRIVERALHFVNEPVIKSRRVAALAYHSDFRPQQPSLIQALHV